MTFHKKNRRKLSELPELTPGVVAAISHADQKVKNRLNAMGIYKGCKIVRKNNSFPVLAEVCGAQVAIGREYAELVIVEAEQKIIFLLGNPNVGKSTIFSRLTGVKTDASNYPGTTVELLKGEAKFNKNFYTIYDTPGVYSLEEDSKTTHAACELVKNTPYDIAVCVADAQNLERNLFFAMNIISLGKPVILLLNKFDAASQKGIIINAPKLSKMLGVPVIPCSGLSGEGFKELAHTADAIASGRKKYRPAEIPTEADDRWKLVGGIIAQTQKIIHRHPSLMEKIEEAASSPLLGIPLAIAVMVLSFMFILHAGEFLIDLLTPLYENYYLPFMQHIFGFTQGTFMWTILFGAQQGAGEGFGILSEAVKIAFIDVLSYVVIFYSVLEFLADLGYLPRMAVLLDRVLHRIGLHGYSAIPIMLGLGCKVPAIMAARSLETRRQRVIVFALILMAAPCISQTAMMFSILAPHGIKYLLLTFAIMAAVGLGISAVLNRLLPGDTTDIFMEVPPWQLPRPRVFIRKIIARAREYVVEATPLIILGILIITLADMAGVIDLLTRVMRAPLSLLMGLPAESAPVVILGFLRKDVSIALLAPFNLSAKQLVIACVFMAMYMPCVGSFFVLLKESGWRDTLMILAITLGTALATGTLLNFIF
ncbi:MAG: fused ferrous iron transport protein A/B [Elusimicrobiota bacterium]|jgi:ferrous iron transport protein B|nr:fused ferrous iron transport protein A/B [Elusimicrobiota bacterium]